MHALRPDSNFRRISLPFLVTNLMFRNGGWRLFLAGVLCGIVLTAVLGGATVWWKLHPKRSAEDAAIYDNCLMAQSGNTVVCDATMRVLDRERAAETVMKTEAAQLLAAGFSKREVMQWAMDRGFVGSQLSDAVGVSLQDLQAGKY
jgi:hypothetical protein